MVVASSRTHGSCEPQRDVTYRQYCGEEGHIQGGHKLLYRDCVVGSTKALIGVLYRFRALIAY